MTVRHRTRPMRGFAFCNGACLPGLLMLCALPVSGSSQSVYRHLQNHVPAQVNRAQRLGRVAAEELISLAISLPLRHESQLDTLLTRLYTPGDALYGHYLTSEQFAAQFAPTQADYTQVAQYVQRQGLTVTNTHANRLVLDVQAPAHTIETAFGIHLNRYQLPEGQTFRAPDSDPVVPQTLADKVQSIIGLDDAGKWVTHNIGRPAPLNFGAELFAPQTQYTLAGILSPLQTGSGPGNALSPNDIKTAYNLNSVTQTGSGQTLALFELDGYKAADVAAYETYFGLPNVTLQNVLVDGATGGTGSGAGEVTLDIELQIALAPGISKILVYEGPNSSKGVIDTYNKIASDNLAKSISTSWGLAETSNSSSTLTSENTIFKQMATQGQSLFAASGDSGAYDNRSTLTVDDPASQPYVTGVGGTHLATVSAGGAYGSETTWNGGSISAGAGGGGISQIWGMPSYQTGFVSQASGGSMTARNVPDVSLDADPNTGYSIYYNSRWYIYGGTSCAAPLWSAFTALVNQQRVANGLAVLGFANPPLYAVGAGANYARDFHDIADNSTNLYYHAVTGYDLATGLGTLNGANLFADLTGTKATGSISNLFSTGLDASGKPAPDSASDLHYTLVSTPGSTGSTAYVTQQHFPIGYWMADTSTSKWISPIADEAAYTDAPGSYTYQTTFTVSGSPSAVQISGGVAGDNQVTAIILNGQTVATNVSSDFAAFTSFTISSGFASGTNTLQFVVNNLGTSPNPSGFRCELSGTKAAAPASVTGLFSTGLDASGKPAPDSASDLHYTLISAPSTGGSALVTQQHFPIGPWMADTSTSKWLSPHADESLYADAPGDYTFQTTFTITGDASTLQISGGVAGDNQVTAIILNGQTVATNVSSDFVAFSRFVLSTGLVSGTNTLQFVVHNLPYNNPDGTQNNPCGFRCEMTAGTR